MKFIMIMNYNQFSFIINLYKIVYMSHGVLGFWLVRVSVRVRIRV